MQYLYHSNCFLFSIPYSRHYNLQLAPLNILQTFALVATEKLTCFCSIRNKNFFPKKELPQNFWQIFASEKNLLPKMKLPKNLWQTFACVVSEKRFPPKNGVASKFIANFCLCSIKKKLPPKNGVASKFMANFCLCSIRKKCASQKWSCLKIYGKLLPM